ncbi:MAG: hypothetical protein ABJL57_11870 [Hyphomonas sp.]|uniref:hypothetical protein n=1 Tax=Hyphomonas sp. TaxID=87 RepID=UPI000C35AA80|nr:hypothetical protein [Hyphomonadaceae bacterium]MBA30107.1 hypothetical protein [Hyphomonadaceae bacterium]QDP63708.1 MAG: hypothetical protein GOVbin258_36 [Prokaryotic dsDNA virus sp.]|tara:strand:- start:28071 stop:28304 length:234 start_codon:yes stop_codon:yes gene_type:complete
MREPTPQKGWSRNVVMEREERLAKRIKAYWFARGFLVETRIEVETFYDRVWQFPVPSIRSDMVNGLPVKRVSGRVRK